MIVMDCRTGGPTFNVAEPVTEPAAAVMRAVPCSSVAARPLVFTVATLIAPDDHVAELVMSFVEPSVSVAVAWNCCVNPAVTVGEAGVTVIDATTGAVTVTVTDPLMDPLVAVMTAVPTVLPVTLPEVLTVATVDTEEDHVAELVISTVDASVKVAVAVSCCDKPDASDGLAGVMTIALI